MKVKRLVSYIEQNQEQFADKTEISALALFCRTYYPRWSLNMLITQLESIINCAQFKLAYDFITQHPLNNYFILKQKRTYLDLVRLHTPPVSCKKRLKKIIGYKPPKIRKAYNIATRPNNSACFVNGMLVAGQSYRDMYEEFENSR